VRGLALAKCQKAVAKLAHELSLRRGCEPGHDVEDWLSAEHILLEQTARSVPSGGRPKPQKRRGASKVSSVS